MITPEGERLPDAGKAVAERVLAASFAPLAKAERPQLQALLASATTRRAVDQGAGLPFGVNAMQCPCGLIGPSTILQAAGSRAFAGAR